jgi:hypothetical protein
MTALEIGVLLGIVFCITPLPSSSEVAFSVGIIGLPNRRRRGSVDQAIGERRNTEDNYSKNVDK